MSAVILAQYPSSDSCWVFTFIFFAGFTLATRLKPWKYPSLTSSLLAQKGLDLYKDPCLFSLFSLILANILCPLFNVVTCGGPLVYYEASVPIGENISDRDWVGQWRVQPHLLYIIQNSWHPLRGLSHSSEGSVSLSTVVVCSSTFNPTWTALLLQMSMIWLACI